MSRPSNEERRFALRMALRLPIVVSGRAEDGAAWSEPTETDDISTLGALFHLNQRVARGDQLYLRAHRPDGSPIEATARVCMFKALSFCGRLMVMRATRPRRSSRSVSYDAIVVLRMA